jgi:type VI secretion system protein ImpF
MSGPASTSRERLQPSLLDRLTDEAPEKTRETYEQQTLSTQQLRNAVLRDLAWLLNTTNLSATEDLPPLAAASTINFGIPDFAGRSETSFLGSLEDGIVHAIKAFEPRIKEDTLRISVRTGDSSRPTPALVFEIAGELWAQPLPQQIFVETAIELETRLAVVTDVRTRG